MAASIGIYPLGIGSFGSTRLWHNTFVLLVDGERYIIDCPERLQPMLEDNLRQGSHPIGIADYGQVLLTHLHVDHVGWNTMLVDGKWVPTFPNARYLIGRAEYDYWRAEEDGVEDPSTSYFHDSVKPVWDAGLVDLVETDHKVCDEVRLEPTLGHTPGHVSIRIRSRGEDALITGDFTHHPCQMAKPEWAAEDDLD